ncbi:MAG: ParB/RepB/Spo0J family partition protein [Patescibacteria group bacterium]|nr:ParB/RepB/Spo0J family partition protein [Patescibacteria group bacterium]
MKTQELKNIAVADCFLSKTNTAGRNKGTDFDELVASVKEKGVLTPILVRAKEGKSKPAWEVIAGNRRWAAAKEAGLKEIPAQIVEMTDEEAREAQIVENLQRADLHPIDEAELFVKLVKTADDFKVLGAKLGKSEAYIRNRIMLLNLAAEVQKAYRDGSLNDGHALEISRLTPGDDQHKALKYVQEKQKWGKAVSVKDLKEFIDQEFFDELKFQPWLKDEEAMKAVGECIECPKDTNTLFGEVKAGACTTIKCYRRKMKKYVDWMKEKTPGLVLVSSGYNPKAGVLGEFDYEKAKKSDAKVKSALVVDGKNRGKIINVVITKMPVNQMTAEEKKEHEKELEKQRIADEKREAAEKEREARKMEGALKNITWPIQDKHLNSLAEIAISRADNDDMTDIAKRLKLEGKCDEDGEFEDVEKVLRGYWEKAGAQEKLRLIFELFLGTLWGDARNKVIKSL